jgi:hypothetical protein
VGQTRGAQEEYFAMEKQALGRWAIYGVVVTNYEGIALENSIMLTDDRWSLWPCCRILDPANLFHLLVRGCKASGIHAFGCAGDKRSLLVDDLLSVIGVLSWKSGSR